MRKKSRGLNICCRFILEALKKYSTVFSIREYIRGTSGLDYTPERIALELEFLVREGYVIREGKEYRLK